jgi:indole-3-glycerol phosphate synthase
MPDNFLDRIVAATQARLDSEPPSPDLADRALAAAEARADQGLRSLERALGGGGPAVIAECKRRSPSAGVLRRPFDPVALARAYEAAGAAAVSVVTEPEYFGGELGWLAPVRSAVGLPVLRKDFVVCERQLEESAAAGADAVLLIQRILEPERLTALLESARKLELEVLLELFVDEDPAPAVGSGAAIIGVNARDLATFATRLDRVEAMATAIPSDRLRVAESGIGCAEDLRRLHRAGYDAFLVGEHLVRADDPARSLRELLS